MKRLIYLVFITLFFFLFIPVVIQGVSAASLKFDQTTVTTTAGQTFNLQVNVDAGADEINSVDAYVKFDSAVLKAASISAGTYFPTVSNNITDGQVYIAGLVEDPASSKQGTGTVATIVFQALANGTTTITYDCTNSKVVKNDINATNVIDCTANGTSVVTVGTGSTATPTPSANSLTPVPSELPKSGIIDNVIKFAVPGMILLFIGMAARLML